MFETSTVCLYSNCCGRSNYPHETSTVCLYSNCCGRSNYTHETSTVCLYSNCCGRSNYPHRYMFFLQIQTKVTTLPNKLYLHCTVLYQAQMVKLNKGKLLKELRVAVHSSKHKHTLVLTIYRVTYQSCSALSNTYYILATRHKQF